MKLVIGGSGAGKLDFVKSELGYRDGEISDAVLDGRPVLYNLQDLVRKDACAWEGLLPLLRDKEVVVCDEVGCGVVPMSAPDREYREAVGRLSTRLAAAATEVIRVYCGIPVYIKGGEVS